jgi:basic membrane protein A
MFVRSSRRSLLAGAAACVAALAVRPALGQARRIKVAGIHTVPVENAWNSRLHAALIAANGNGTIAYLFSESVANADYVRVMRQYADQGAALIVGESYGVEKEARRVAKDYPQTAFLMGSSGKPDGPNFGVFGTWNHEAAYLTGLMAGHLTRKGQLGAVGGYPIPEVNRLINAFRIGVREVRPEAKFTAQFIGTWFDPPKAKEAALAQIDAGADILFGERIGTAEAARERGILAVGSLIDYMPRYPKTVFANAMWYFDPILAAAVTDVVAGKLTGKDYSPFSFMAHGGNDVTYDAAIVPPAAIRLVEAKRADIKAGSLKVQVDDAKPA